MKYFLYLIILLPQLALAQPDWRLSLRTGQSLYLDAGYGLVSDVPLHSSGELGLDYLALPLSAQSSLGLGAAYHLSGIDGTVYGDVDAQYTHRGVRAHALYRWAASDALAVIGRVGAAHRATRMRLIDGSRELDVEVDHWGIHGGLGVDYLFGDPSPVDMDQSCLGLSLELTYAHFADLDLSAGGTPLGALDPSGPGWLMGLTYVW